MWRLAEDLTFSQITDISSVVWVFVHIVMLHRLVRAHAQATTVLNMWLQGMITIVDERIIYLFDQIRLFGRLLLLIVLQTVFRLFEFRVTAIRFVFKLFIFTYYVPNPSNRFLDILKRT